MKTASIIIIGNEILSGRTRDTNSNYLAKKLVERGISLQEIRCIPDNVDIISNVVKSEASSRDYVFTSGGIGPTHDDITADAISACFGLPLIVREDAVELLASNYKNGKKDLNQARLRMARVPQTSVLIKNPVSGAPGFRVSNVFVMAGVPLIFQAMVNEIIFNLGSSTPIFSKTIKVYKRESDISEKLSEHAEKFKDIAIGSYPFELAGEFGVEIVMRHTDIKLLEMAFEAISVDFNEL